MITIAATMGFNRTLLDAVDACIRCIRGMIPDVFDYSHERVGIKNRRGDALQITLSVWSTLAPIYGRFRSRRRGFAERALPAGSSSGFPTS